MIRADIGQVLKIFRNQIAPGKNKTVIDENYNLPTPYVEKAGGAKVFDDEPIKSPQIEE